MTISIIYSMYTIQIVTPDFNYTNKPIFLYATFYATGRENHLIQ